MSMSVRALRTSLGAALAMMLLTACSPGAQEGAGVGAEGETAVSSRPAPTVLAGPVVPGFWCSVVAIGLAGRGPDHVRAPRDAVGGSYRLCAGDPSTRRCTILRIEDHGARPIESIVLRGGPCDGRRLVDLGAADLRPVISVPTPTGSHARYRKTGDYTQLRGSDVAMPYSRVWVYAWVA